MTSSSLTSDACADSAHGIETSATRSADKIRVRIRPPLVAEENMEKCARKTKRDEERGMRKSVKKSGAHRSAQLLFSVHLRSACVVPNVRFPHSSLLPSWSHPPVVLAINVGERELRVNFHHAHGRAGGDADGLRAGAGEPGLNGKLEALRPSIGARKDESHRHRREAAV